MLLFTEGVDDAEEASVYAIPESLYGQFESKGIRLLLEKK